MSRFDSHGVAIAYETLGVGRPIVLIHGFASTRTINWKNPRWFDTLAEVGRQVIALDCRGHGQSDKPHDPAAYHPDHMAGDVIRMMDVLGIERADLMGYSMGGRIAAGLLARHPERFESVVLAGIGSRGVTSPRPGAEATARALEVADPNAIVEPSGRAFREFAEHYRNDLHALAACMRGFATAAVDAADLQRTRVPVLIVVGEKDELVGDPQPLAALIPTARVVMIPGRDHLSTVGDRRYKEAVVDFLRN
ncbi:MAG TPA: alpha/beta fold hydrolase [Candidatus Binatia bacterium]|nr:alpha/beta fold hydrolase [Candidatus Binatia bacterium]